MLFQMNSSFCYPGLFFPYTNLLKFDLVGFLNLAYLDLDIQK